MRSIVRTLILCQVIASAGCSDAPTRPADPPVPTSPTTGPLRPISLNIRGPQTLALGESDRLTLWGVTLPAGGGFHEYTYDSRVQWQSSDPRIVALGGDRGRDVTAVSPGEAVITATLRTETETVQATRAIRVLTTPFGPPIKILLDEGLDFWWAGGEQRVVATAYYEHRTKEITLDATWETSDSSVARVLRAGWLQGVGGGETEIRATYFGVTGSLRIKVWMPSSLSLSAVTSTWHVGQGILLAIYAHFPNGERESVQSLATWTISDPTVVEMPTVHYARALRAGTAEISATYLGLTSVLRITVLPHPTDRLETLKTQPGGTYRPQGTASMRMDVYWVLASTDSAQLALNLKDQDDKVIAPAATATRSRGDGTWSPFITFVVPAGTLKVCPLVTMTAEKLLATTGGPCVNVS